MCRFYLFKEEPRKDLNLHKGLQWHADEPFHSDGKNDDAEP